MTGHVRGDVRKAQGRCAEHGDALVTEPGGDNMPTLYGRRYCPTCQELFFAALDEQTPTETPTQRDARIWREGWEAKRHAHPTDMPDCPYGEGS